MRLCSRNNREPYNRRSTAQERKKSMATGKALNGKPYAGNPHVRFDEGEVASAATPRRGSLLYKQLKIRITCTVVAVLVMAFVRVQANLNDSAPENTKNLPSTNSVESCVNGEGTSLNKAETVNALRRTAESGSAKAQFELGKRYECGDGVEANAAEAVKWYRMAAEQDFADAQKELAECYIRGGNTADARKWYRRAAEGYRKAAELGDAEAQFELGNCYRDGFGVERNAVEAVKWYRKAAEQGLGKAQLYIARCCCPTSFKPHQRVFTRHINDGPLMDVLGYNCAEGVKWYRKAADLGNVNAQIALGNCYRDGKGVESNAVEAVKWYSMAAEQDFAEAFQALGYCYLNGVCVEKDVTKASAFFRMATEHHGRVDDDTKIKLGDCYRDGVGVEKNSAEAVKWYRKALCCNSDVYWSDSGICVKIDRGIYIKDNKIGCENHHVIGLYTNSVAALRLADCYENGIGVEKNAAEAVRLVQQAANKGLYHPAKDEVSTKVEAMRRLANYYANGVGVEKSIIEATKWRLKAWWWAKVETEKWFTMLCEIGPSVLIMAVLCVLWNFIGIKDIGFIKLRRKANAGDIDAMLEVAFCYLYGTDVKKNEAKAAKWYHRAAEHGNAKAQVELGDCYRCGRGVKKNDEEAAKWYREAASQGDERAASKLKEMDSKD